MRTTAVIAVIATTAWSLACASAECTLAGVQVSSDEWLELDDTGAEVPLLRLTLEGGGADGSADFALEPDGYGGWLLPERVFVGETAACEFDATLRFELLGQEVDPIEVDFWADWSTDLETELWDEWDVVVEGAEAKR